MNMLRELRDAISLQELGIATQNPAALVSSLNRSTEVKSIRDSYRSGSITESNIRTVVNELLMSLRIGERFSGELFLAAVAVALTPFMDRFTAEYIDDLANLKLRELFIASAVAKRCKAVRMTMPKNLFHPFTLGRRAERNVRPLHFHSHAGPQLEVRPGSTSAFVHHAAA